MEQPGVLSSKASQKIAIEFDLERGAFPEVP